MENKYYTPEIEEFHVGFEYEYLQGSSWYKHNLGDSPIIHPELDEFTDDLMKLSHAITRVKYLDKEYIESLGFIPTHNKYYTINAPGKLGYWTEVHLDFRWGLEDISIKGFRGEENDYLFRGIIKNKSELKKLLKQLNII